MGEIRLSKEAVIKLIKSAKRIQTFHDKKWPYIYQGATQGTCCMLDMCIKIEKREGYVIYIPGNALPSFKPIPNVGAMNGRAENVSDEEWEKQRNS